MRRTPRKFEDVIPHTSWFFWDTCCSCNMEFRRERGWSKGYVEWRALSVRFLCATCAPTREDAVDVYSRRPWETALRLPPAPPPPPPPTRAVRGDVRPLFLNGEILNRAKRDGEAQLLAISKKLQAE